MKVMKEKSECPKDLNEDALSDVYAGLAFEWKYFHFDPQNGTRPPFGDLARQNLNIMVLIFCTCYILSIPAFFIVFIQI